MKNDEVLLSIKNLKQYFNEEENEVRAIEIFRLIYTKGKH